jgi:hypothetical protein
MPNFLFDGPNFLRKPKQFKNLTIAEVSSCVNGAGYKCEVVLRKREEEKMRQSHEPFALTDKMEVERAKRINAALSLSKLCKQHSDGEIDGATFSTALQGFARMEYGTGKDAMQKYIAAHHEELSQKLKADYSAMHAAHDQQQATGVGNGLGLQRLNQNGVLSDGVNSPNAVGNQPVASGNESYTAKFAPPADMLVTVENISVIAKKYFNGDVVKAATVLRQRGQEEFESARVASR